MVVVPLTLAIARDFVFRHHRHNKPPVGCKFAIGLRHGEELVGVATAGRPVARAFDDGYVIEVNRTCTDGTPNANSMLYGAAWRAAKAMGYLCGCTYTQGDESGASLRAAGWVRIRELAPRGDWKESSVTHRDLRDPPQGSLLEPDARARTGNTARVLWGIGQIERLGARADGKQGIEGEGEHGQT
jgi:hypothetical protein